MERRALNISLVEGGKSCQHLFMGVVHPKIAIGAPGA